jgi:glycosyltransferase involved in cell wall biosynthesis
MKILINAWQMEPHITGTDRFAHNTLRELQRIDHTNSYEINCLAGNTYIPSIITNENFNVKYYKRARMSDPLALPGRIYRNVRRRFIDPVDVYFSFHNFSTPLIKFSPVVVSDLDLVPVVFPDQYQPYRLKRLVYMALLRKAIRAADHFIAISKYSKRELAKLFGVDPDKVTVVYLAAEERFKPAAQGRQERVRKKYSLPKKFILSMGATEPRKNVRRVVEAYKGLPQQLRDEYALVVIGQQWHSETIKDWGIQRSDRMLFTGYVEDEDLPILYSACSVFVFASYYEGFGLPPLEAMSCGAPIICSNTTSLPEIVGDAAQTFDPFSVSQISERLQEVLANPRLMKQMTQKGLAQAGNFSWYQTAEQLYEVLTQFDDSTGEHSRSE